MAEDRHIVIRAEQTVGSMTSADQGNVYHCDWEKTPTGYAVWLVEHPWIISRSEHSFECEDSICYEIVGHFGDGEAVLTYEKGLTEEAIPVRHSSLAYYILASNYGCFLNDLGQYFLSGVCGVCRHAMGSRNEVGLIVDVKAQNTDSILISRSSILIFSERVIDALAPFNQALYEVRPVDFSQKKRSRFYEIIWTHKNLSIESVAVKDDKLGDYQAWRCSACPAHGSFYQDERGLKYFAPREKLVEYGADMFLLNRKILCISDAVLSKLSRLRLRKLSADPVGVVRKGDVFLDPDVEIRLPKKKTRPKLPG